jgi:hypothetical protein
VYYQTCLLGILSGIEGDGLKLCYALETEIVFLSQLIVVEFLKEIANEWIMCGLHIILSENLELHLVK